MYSKKFYLFLFLYSSIFTVPSYALEREMLQNLLTRGQRVYILLRFFNNLLTDDYFALPATQEYTRHNHEAKIADEYIKNISLELTDAAAHNDFETMIALYDKGAQCDIADDLGATPLLYSVIYNNPSATQFILERLTDYRSIYKSTIELKLNIARSDFIPKGSLFREGKKNIVFLAGYYDSLDSFKVLVDMYKKFDSISWKKIIKKSKKYDMHPFVIAFQKGHFDIALYMFENDLVPDWSRKDFYFMINYEIKNDQDDNLTHVNLCKIQTPLDLFDVASYRWAQAQNKTDVWCKLFKHIYSQAYPLNARNFFNLLTNLSLDHITLCLYESDLKEMSKNFNDYQRNACSDVNNIAWKLAQNDPERLYALITNFKACISLDKIYLELINNIINNNGLLFLKYLQEENIINLFSNSHIEKIIYYIVTSTKVSPVRKDQLIKLLTNKYTNFKTLDIHVIDAIVCRALEKYQYKAARALLSNSRYISYKTLSYIFKNSLSIPDDIIKLVLTSIHNDQLPYSTLINNFIEAIKVHDIDVIKTYLVVDERLAYFGLKHIFNKDNCKLVVTKEMLEVLFEKFDVINFISVSEVDNIIYNLMAQQDMFLLNTLLNFVESNSNKNEVMLFFYNALTRLNQDTVRSVSAVTLEKYKYILDRAFPVEQVKTFNKISLGKYLKQGGLNMSKLINNNLFSALLYNGQTRLLSCNMEHSSNDRVHNLFNKISLYVINTLKKMRFI
ncbi:hypothetical protein J120_04010 [candidate division TM6 bacterium JCVI TM6SC1]|uniref:Uncharacterized protein n=1 Tax=candidate division TM6 bacterium JCVI TM6SC1 TaxID=1306947 RepID=A0A0D2JL18_9BACT|nr:hypothetical protein J120_04010 [candidate division TM6 bacterium JCVI TM6SC1]